MAEADNPPNSRSIWGRIKNDPVPFVIEVVAAVATVLALAKRAQLGILLALVALAVWLLPFAPKVKDRRILRLALPATLTAALTVIALLLILDRPHAERLAFEKVSRAKPCNDFKGKGTIPAGKKLLVFDREVTANGVRLGSGGYYFDGAAAPAGHGWIIREVEIVRDADYDAHAEVTAGLVSENYAGEYMARYQGERSRLNLPLPNFDEGTQMTMQVIRPKGQGGC